MEQHPPDIVEDAGDASPPEDGLLLAETITDDTGQSATDNGIASPPVPRPSRSRHVLRGAIRAFLVLAFSRYVITAIIVILAALVVSREASDILVDKFDALAQTIRRF
ncbi:MAG: hypothetical protein J0G28_09080 [Afipia sp.]|nr:hypothetical protein [Afipia sp.]OJW61890.1 MAG: hypothetical protein BGO65_01670 [Afipia sp. 64-13]